MTFFAPVLPLADRIRADEQAVQILRTLADMVNKLERAPKAYDVQQRINQSEKSFALSLYSTLNAGLIDRKEPSGRLHLTRKGWAFLGGRPPFWMEN